MWNFINKFNNFSNNPIYSNLFNSLWIGTFILGLLFQKFYGKKRNCKLIGNIANILHHFILFVIYFGWLAPAYLLSFMLFIALITLFSWVFLKNICVLTNIENYYCNNKQKYFKDVMDYIEPINFGKFNLKYRNKFIYLIIFIVAIRFYTYIFKSSNTLDIQAHRGGRGYYPENTLVAFDNALKNNINTLELDTHLTKDNIIVIYHDDKINNLCFNDQIGNDKYLTEMTINEIKSYDCGSIKNNLFPNQKQVPGTKIPTLVELFEFVKSSNYPNKNTVKFNIEIKVNDIQTNEHVINHTKKLLDLIKQYNLQDRVIIQSFNLNALKYIEQNYPFIKTSYLVKKNKTNDYFINDILQNNIDYISPDYRILNKDIINEYINNDINIIPWTVNNLNNFKELKSLGINHIITDYPIHFKHYYVNNS